MLDFVLLLVQLPRPKKIVNCLVVLHGLGQQWYPKIRDQTYNLQELTLHLVFPPFLPHHLRNLEHLFHSTRDHALGQLRNTTFHGKRFTRASLAVRKDTDVIPVNTTLSKLRDILEDFRLSRMWLEDLGCTMRYINLEGIQTLPCQR